MFALAVGHGSRCTLIIAKLRVCAQRIHPNMACVQNKLWSLNLDNLPSSASMTSFNAVFAVPSRCS